MTFYTLGGFRAKQRNACNAPRLMYLGNALITGRHWRTAPVLRIGSSVAKLGQLYSAAERHDEGDSLFDGWWLTQKTCYIPKTAPCSKYHRPDRGRRGRPFGHPGWCRRRVIQHAAWRERCTDCALVRRSHSASFARAAKASWQYIAGAFVVSATIVAFLQGIALASPTATSEGVTVGMPFNGRWANNVPHDNDLSRTD